MAIDFNGTDESLYLASHILPTTYPFSIACWVKPDALGANYGLMSESRYDASDWQYGLFTESSADKLRIFATNTGNAASGEALSTAPLTVDVWNHCGGVFDLATRTAYLNGVAGTPETTSVSRDTSGTVRGFVGARQTGAGTTGAFLNGKLAEVAVWNVALTAAEWAALAKGFSPLLIRPASLVSYLPMNDDNAPFDLKGGTFTAENDPAKADHPPIIKAS